MRTASELIGESVREMGVLIAVFVRLDAVFYEGRLSFLALIGLGFLEFAGLALIAVGVMLERQKE